jgi:hypothetical protein
MHTRLNKAHMLYTVVAYRWGWTNETPQPQSCVTADLARACAIAEEVADNGAGKYGVAVYEWPSELVRKLHTYIPSTYGEAEPFDNPNLEMFSSIGHAVHSAVTTGTLWQAADEGQAGVPDVPYPALVPDWVANVVREKAQGSAFSMALHRLNQDRKAQGQPPVGFGERSQFDPLWDAAGAEVDAKLAGAEQSFRDIMAARQERFGPLPRDGRKRSVHLSLDYLPLEPMLELVDDPAKTACKQLLNENRALFEAAPGSRHNHQAWVGGYLDHVVDGMNYARHLYALDTAIGRPMPFSLSDALLIFFLHDLEKPWRILARADGTLGNASGFENKAAFKAFRERKLADMGLVLTPAQHNALTYVEGEGDAYSSSARVMNELAAFCHKVDIWSARQCHDYPKANTDEWTGAGRFRHNAA